MPAPFIPFVPKLGFLVAGAAVCAAPLAETRAALDGLTLPNGFEMTVFHAGVGRARHIAVRDNGDVFVGLTSGELVALRDTDDDGTAETVERREAPVHTGLAIHDGFLYVTNDTTVSRVALDGDLMPSTPFDVVVSDMPAQTSHAAAPIAFDADGHLYVGSGAPSNACQDPQRTPGQPGIDPCPQLAQFGGIWRFDAGRTGQTFAQGERYITGMRQVVAMDWIPSADKLGLVMHGRDQLNSLWPDLYDDEENAENPAEEFHIVREGDNLGWPYTYWDPNREVRMVGPEYGGDGQTPSDNPDFKSPDYAFFAHWAPNDMIFYRGEAFPERYRKGAFIAFHGSWNRAPEPQQGYQVVFMPLNGTGEETTVDKPFPFITGFPGKQVVERSSDARYRPMGLAEDPEGGIYVVDSQKGRIWHVTYEGDEK